MEIKYPKKKSEAEIQALLWYFLRKRKVDARLQVTSGHWKLDLVVFKEEVPICIVECKSWSPRYSILQGYQRTKNTKQIQKYQGAFGLPVFVIGRANQVSFIISRIEDLLSSNILQA